jgi:RNA polymerase sigma factor (sigma-70 family)
MSRPVSSSDELAQPPASVPSSALDARGFDALFSECAADVHAYAISLLRDRAAAEDVTALAFERLYRSRMRLDTNRGTPRAWLFSIARNAALDELRRRRRRPRILRRRRSTGGRMRIITFPGGDPADPESTWVLELEDALNGEAQGSSAESWRELREDVRALAPPMTPAFEQRLRERLAERQTARRRHSRLGRARALGRARRLIRPRAVAAMASVAVAILAVLVVGLGGSRRPGSEARPEFAVAHRAGGAPAVKAASPVHAEKAAEAPATSATGSSAAKAGAQDLAPATGGPAAPPGRVQQLAASVSLSVSPASVQSISEGVARLAVRNEGYVQQSHVQVQQHGSSEASLSLKLPSARLAAALAAIARLAPVSAESQSLQDITNAYEVARQRLADARAERQALLRALAAATTEGQIDSLRERLSQSRSAITQDQAAVQSVSQRASTAEVEVTVLADAAGSSSTSEGLTLRRGLHDALRVLTVALIGILIAGLAIARRVWRRYQRERALDRA